MTLVILFPTLAEAKPRAKECYDIKEEPPSPQTVVKKFPEFNIQIKMAKNTNAVKLKDGNILLVDNGTYRYLRCLQKNPYGLGKGIFGVLISKGDKDYPVNNQLPDRPSTYIVATQNYDRVALRFIFDNGNTDISLYGGGPLESTEDITEEIKSLVEIMKSVTFLSNY